MKQLIGHRKGSKDDLVLAYAGDADEWSIQSDWIVVKLADGQKQAFRIYSDVVRITEQRVPEHYDIPTVEIVEGKQPPEA